MSAQPLSSGRPPIALDAETMRFLEVHETQAHAIPGRRFLDLGDCVALHAPTERDPFYNRVAAIRWAADDGAFEHRLAEILALFAGLDRSPNLWLASGYSTPRDIADRLARHGFHDQGGGHLMILVDPVASGSPSDRDARIELERLHVPEGTDVDRAVERVAIVQAEAFGVGDDDLGQAQLTDLRAAFCSPAFHVCLVSVDGEPAAVGKRYTFGGASYLSSIGTRPSWQSRGLGRLVTETLIRDSVASGTTFTYLGVQAHNGRARRLYERLGFVLIGVRFADFLLR